MSHRTLDDSPASSTDSLHNPAGYTSPQILSVGPPPVPDKDKPYGSRLGEQSYWDPYAGSLTPNEQNEAADSIPLVGLQPHRHLSDGSQRVHVIPNRGPKRWWNAFEPVPLVPILVHALLCFAAFPIIFFISRAASGMTLFWARLIVGGLCGGVGLTLGVSLLDLSRRSMEAALWAVIIHESLKGEINEELDYHTANPLSPWAAILLLYKQFLGKTSPSHRKAIRKVRDDRTPWWLCIVLFLITATIAASLVFVLGRVVDIYTVQQTQTSQYYETTVVGDVTPDEIARAASQVEETFSQVRYTWTITPLSSSAHIPTDRYFAFNRTSHTSDSTTVTTDTIHFSETFPSQLAPPEQQPYGFGTFLNQSEVGGITAADIQDEATNKVGAGPTTRAVGQIVRWPRWGSRIKCQLIEDLGRYL
ncbi:hypothetical protein FRC12_009580 [Ceratobasidium sp. 428]|nr:hypothetical protein FRC12_009580 [Ceratobasidium sp. 428]